MDKLWWLLVFVTNLLPHGACLQEDVGISEPQQQGYSLEVMAASIRQLKALTDKLDKRLDTVERMEKRLDIIERLEKRLDTVERLEKRLDTVERLEKRFKDQDKNIQTLNEKLDKKLEPILKLEKKLKLLEKFEKRLDEHDKILLEQNLSLEMEDKKLQRTRVHPIINKTTAGQPESFYLEKRSDDTASWEPVVDQVSQRLNLAEANIQALKNSELTEQQAKGTVYVRWGSSECPSSAETVYSGFIGGSWFQSSEAAANYLCLPHDPAFDSHTVPRNGHASLYGAEYQTCDEPECDLLPTCAVCHISKESYMMLPARNTCYSGWTLEYSGYLMTNDVGNAGMDYICVDSSRDYILGTKADENGALLYYTAYACGSLPCPPYVSNKIVLCAVCSK